MNEKRILEKMGDISPEFVEEARPKKRRRLLPVLGSVAAGLVLLVGTALILPRTLGRSLNASQAPQAAPNGEEDLRNSETSATDVQDAFSEDKHLLARADFVSVGIGERRSAAASVESIESFTAGLTDTMLVSGENLVWSPASVYTALGMLAETAHGDTLAELLNVLGADSVESARRNAGAIISAETARNEYTSAGIANSLWLNNGYAFDTDILERLASGYNASSYWGDPAEESFSRALRSWLNTATGGLLEENIRGVNLDRDTVMALYSAVMFRAQWKERYSEHYTERLIFHAADGDMSCDFMHKERTGARYLFGSGFTAVCEEVEGGSVWYMLPDEGISVGDMLDNGGYAFMFSDKTGLPCADFELSVPKLDIESEFDLIPSLQRLGVVTCFDRDRADFSGLTTEPVFVSQASHAARLVTDEDGVSAAAYTEIRVAPGAAAPEPTTAELFRLVLDRPFAVFITGLSGAPLFVAVVNTPTE